MARVPTGDLGQGGEHPGVERAAGHPAGTEDEGDGQAVLGVSSATSSATSR